LINDFLLSIFNKKIIFFVLFIYGLKGVFVKSIDFQDSVDIADKNYLVSFISSLFDDLDLQRQK